MQEQITSIKNWLQTGSINLFGAPFAGKDTQANIIADLIGAKVISSGQLLRENKDNPKLQQAMADGGIVPSELFFEIVLPYLKSDELAGKPLILSEMGRKNLSEAEGTIKVASDAGHQQKVVVLLNLSDQEIWKRFRQSQLDGDRGKRDDDNEAVLQTRIDKFKNEVMPVIEYYRQKDQLIEIDGSPTKDLVTEAVIKALALKAS
jgi:adenylate kinase